MKFQMSLLANQPNRFRPLKFHGVQNLIILYQVDQTPLLPRFSSSVIGERIQDQDYMCHTHSLFFHFAVANLSTVCHTSIGYPGACPIDQSDLCVPGCHCTIGSGEVI